MNIQGTILLVEDDTALAEGLRFTLEKEGFAVETASTAGSAIEAAATGHFILALLDVSLPDDDGFSVCREIRRNSSLPIIFLTAREEEIDVVRGLDMGGDDYITKPFRINELLSRIRSVLRRHQDGQRQGSSISSGGITLDRERGTVERDGDRLDLTPLEYRLLTILMEADGKIVPRDRIHQALWNHDEHFVDDNTLAVHIRRLREKVERQPEKPERIVTVRGVGYKWA